MKNILAIVIPIFLLGILYFFISKQNNLYNYDIVLCDSTIIMCKDYRDYNEMIIIEDCTGNTYYYKSEDILYIRQKD